MQEPLGMVMNPARIRFTAGLKSQYDAKNCDSELFEPVNYANKSIRV